MSRDHRKLRIFHDADALVIDTYKQSASFPPEERFGLQAQLRRAALSVPTNIVEGAARRSAAEYCRFLEVAHASARECHYLLTVAVRLKIAPSQAATELSDRFSQLAGSILATAMGIERLAEQGKSSSP